MIRYLPQEEKWKTRKLWEEAFPEDSESFDHYYYDSKVWDNQIAVREEEGHVISMAHLNPYRISVKGQLWNINYIVGVATDREYRHQGHMRAILTRILTDMYGQQMPFCFLLPADEKIYLPFDFTYLSDQQHLGLKQDAGVKIQAFSQEHMESAIRWQNEWLSDHYQVFSLRDAAYMKAFLEELESEQGKLELIYKEDQMAGIRSEWGIGKIEQRSFLCRQDLSEEKAPPQPAMMGRIIHLASFVSVIRLKHEVKEGELHVCIRVSDDLIPENDHIFLWHLSKTCSRLEQVEEDENLLPVFTVTISQMTGWLFGYSTLEALQPGQAEVPEWCNKIETLQGVFLDEVV